MASSSGIDSKVEVAEVKAKIRKIEADFESAKAKLQKAEQDGDKELIIMYGNRVVGLEARLTGLEALLPKPGKISPICSHNLLCLYILFLVDAPSRKRHRVYKESGKKDARGLVSVVAHHLHKLYNCKSQGISLCLSA